MTLRRALGLILIVAACLAPAANAAPRYRYYVELHLGLRPASAQVSALEVDLKQDPSVGGYWYVTCEQQLANLIASTSTLKHLRPRIVCKTSNFFSRAFRPLICVAAKPSPFAKTEAWTLLSRYAPR